MSESLQDPVSPSRSDSPSSSRSDIGFLDWSKDLENVLEDPEGVELFWTFLLSRNASSSLRFYFLCKSIKNITSELHGISNQDDMKIERKSLRAKLRSVMMTGYREFLCHSTSVYFLGNEKIVSTKDREKVARIIKKCGGELYKYPSLFDEILGKVMNHLRLEHAEFAESELYINFVREEVVRRNTEDEEIASHSASAHTSLNESNLSSYLIQCKSDVNSPISSSVPPSQGPQEDHLDGITTKKKKRDAEFFGKLKEKQDRNVNRSTLSGTLNAENIANILTELKDLDRSSDEASEGARKKREKELQSHDKCRDRNKQSSSKQSTNSEKFATLLSGMKETKLTGEEALERGIIQMSAESPLPYFAGRQFGTFRYHHPASTAEQFDREGKSSKKGKANTQGPTNYGPFKSCGSSCKAPIISNQLPWDTSKLTSFEKTYMKANRQPPAAYMWQSTSQGSKFTDSGISSGASTVPSSACSYPGRSLFDSRTAGPAVTSIQYFYPGEKIPYETRAHMSPPLTLAAIKKILPSMYQDSKLFKYFFACPSDDFETNGKVWEHVSIDEAQVPMYRGKVIAKIEHKN